MAWRACVNRQGPSIFWPVGMAQLGVQILAVQEARAPKEGEVEFNNFVGYSAEAKQGTRGVA
eukprot:3942766-Prorocentrum_lima.AAC.1